jgi:hypothetical protein
MSKLDDIDYLSGLIYEYLYQKIQSRPIESTMLSTNFLEDLTIIKKMYKGKQLNDIINNVFNTNLSYSGFYESAYVFKRLNNPQTDILIREYPLNQESNPNTSLNVDKIINYVLSDLVIHKKTKNILINICNIDIPTSELEIFIKKYPEIKVKNMLSVSIREHFYKLITLRECLEKENNIEIYKDCIFQVLHCLDVIQSMYPSFRHNNLNIDTILMYKKSEKKNTYTLNKKNYAFTSSGDIKITNFLKSSIKDYVENVSIEPDLQSPNIYYDIDIFLQSLLSLKLPKKISEFISRNYEKGITARQIILNDSLFTNEELEELEDNIQTGGKRKNNKKSKKSKYNMSREEVEKILNIETPEEETLNFLKNKNINSDRNRKSLDNT